MCSKSNPRKCRCCNEFFVPDPRNVRHQLYCSEARCKSASKSASQRRWLRKPANRDYFKSPENVQRVQLWRKANPGYWKKRSAPPAKPQPAAPQPLAQSSPLVTQPTQSSGTLQDVCLTDHPVFIGLISMFTGSELQEDIASITRRLEYRGRDILGLKSPEPSQNQSAYDCQTSDSS
jgi:hypothetical protein